MSKPRKPNPKLDGANPIQAKATQHDQAPRYRGRKGRMKPPPATTPAKLGPARGEEH